MKKFVFSNDVKVSLGLALVGLIAGIAVVIWQLGNPSIAESIPGNVSKEVLVAASAFQVMILTFILSLLGMKLSKKVGFKMHLKLNAKDALSMIIVSGLTSFILVASDKFIFARFLGEYANTKFHLNLMELAGSVLYGGIIEEVIMRLFLLSLLTFILYKVFARKSSASELPHWIYITAIIVVALVFAAGHLPTTKVLFGLSTPIIIRCFLLNGLGGLVFGYYYWKKGFTMAVASHATVHLFRLLLFMPLLF